MSMRRRYYWPRMALDCYETVESCERCTAERVNLQRNSEKMQLFTPEGPLEDVAMDLLGELPKTTRGNKYLLVIVDRFSKMVRTVPLSSTGAWNLAKAFTTHWVFIFGPPRTILTDKGTNFTSKFMLEFHRQMGIQPHITTAYHPQTNGQTERFNRTIMAALRKFCADHHKDWDLFTDALTFGYNTHVHTATNMAPFELVLSRPPTLQGIEDTRIPKGHTKTEARELWMKKVAVMVKQARSYLDKTQTRMKEHFDKRLRRRSKNIQQGDYVYVRREKGGKPQGERNKLSKKVDGPFRVKERRQNTTVIHRGKVLEEVNTSRLEKTRKPRGAPEVVLEPESRQGRKRGNRRYVVDRITDHYINPEGYMEFLFKWKFHEEKTWEPSSAPPVLPTFTVTVPARESISPIMWARPELDSQQGYFEGQRGYFEDNRDILRPTRIF